MGFVLVILLLYSFVLTKASVPSVTNTTVEVKQLSILGVDLTLASYTLEFDQELYSFRSGLCTAFDCSNDDRIHNEQSDCVCDYTNTTGICGVGSLYNGTGSCTCSQASLLCDQSRSPWTDIDVRGLNGSQVIQGSLLQGGTQNYRLFVNQSCFAFRAYLNTAYGNTALLISNQGIATTTNSPWSLNNAKEKPDFSICPADEHYVRGTYYLAVKAFSDVEFELVIQPLYVPSPNVTVNTDTCQTIPPSQSWLYPANCLYDGVPYRTQCPSYFLGVHYFNVTFPNNQCTPVHISLDGYGLGLQIGVIAGYYDEAPSTPTFFNSTWSTVTGSRISTILCPRYGEPWTVLWIGVPCWVSGYDYSNYTIYVTTQHFDKWIRNRLADTPVFEANNDLLGIAEVVLPKPIGNQGSLVTCTDRGYSCQTISFALASQYLNPFFPVPPLLTNLQGFEDLFLSITGNFSLPIPYIPRPNAISVLVLMSYKTASSVTLLEPSDVDDVIIRFLGKVGSITGETINQNFTATISKPTCVYSDFKSSVQTMSSIIQELSSAASTVELNSIRYKLDSATFQSGYYACQEFVDNLTSVVDSETVNTTSFACTRPETDPAWSTDPCCNSQASWEYTCYPQNISVPLVEYFVQQNKVEKVCKNVQCSQSYLEDYALAKKSFQAGQCSIHTDVSLEVSSVQKKYRYCKEQTLQLPKCYSDSDCFYSNQTYSCNVLTRSCLIPHQVQEKAFIACLATQLTEAQETYLQEKYNITSLMEDPQFVEDWYSKVTTEDCVTPYGSTVNLNHRNKVVIAPADLACAAATSCASYECEDTTCSYPETTCMLICEGDTLSYETSTDVECTSDVQCNWNSTLCDNQTPAACGSLCAGPNFCGLCQNSECIEFSGISAAACASTTVCVLFNGSYVFNISESQCNSLAACDVPCGYTCAAFNPSYQQGICYSYPANSGACASLGGVWTSNTGVYTNNTNPNVCVFPGVSQSACQAIPSTFFDSCSSLSSYDCNQCTQGRCLQFNQNILQCGLVEVPCLNGTSCTGSGSCSDSEFFINPGYAIFGACEVPRFPPVNGVSDHPFCEPSLTTIPNACINWTISTQEECYSKGGTWHFPAVNSSTCTMEVGCLDQTENQLRFSPKSETDCTSEYNQGTWESYWQWTPGRWVGGVQRNLTWTARQTFPKYQWTNTSSFFALETDYFGSASHILALQSKSAALCQFETTLSSMQSVVCDCTESGATDCFDDISSFAVAQLQVCQMEAFSTFYPDIILTGYNNSVELFCADILLSKIPANNYMTQTPERLLANFVPLTNNVPKYAVFNKKDAVVGVLVGDGLSIKPLGEGKISSLELCLRKSISNDETGFPVRDFATDEGGEIVPRNMDIYIRKIVDGTVNDGTYYCALINVTTEEHYFAIERKSTYEDVDQETLTPVAEVFTYTLASVFLLASILVSAQLILYLHSWYIGSLPLILEHFLVFFIWMFVCVRTIYFFLVAGGFDSQIGDYALVALPTFFYFTGFTIIIILWAVVASKRFTNDIEKFKRVINRAVIIINGVLYATFIALILAFQYGKSSEESPCGSRQETNSNSDEIRRNVSIAYGLIISITSFIIGVLFIVFGVRIRIFIMASDSNERIFVVTAVCSVCFLLHCAFILAVSFMKNPNLYFSFFGLIITEWLPAIFIISWLFVRRRNVLLSGSSNTGSNIVGSGGPKKLSKSGSYSRTVEMRHAEGSITDISM